jgi:hypothetical protein
MIGIDLRSVDFEKDDELEVKLPYIFNYDQLRAAASDACEFFLIYFDQVKSHPQRKTLQLEVRINFADTETTGSINLINPVINVGWLPKGIIQEESEYKSKGQFVLFAEQGKYPNLPPNIIH